MGQVSSRMGGLGLRRPLGRRNGQTQDDDADPEQATFSTSIGSYFGSHFLMCGGRFDIAKPEAYLFGENSDLDLLGNRAVPFPHPAPLGSDEVHPLNLMINIRKESVKFTRVREEDGSLSANLYRVEFTLDADCPCSVQILFNARELYQDGEIQFVYRNKRVINSEVYHFDMGSDQTFNNYIFDASRWDISELAYMGGMYFSIVLVIQTEGVDRAQMQSTMCTVDVANDNSRALILKPLRQKIACDGVVYLLQEIFGIENKEPTGEGSEDGGLECIICMSDVRDTVILPCRHLCICNNCADTLRYKLNNCPICRSPFRALIQLKAKRMLRNQMYETVTLVEGLNGPLNHGNGGYEREEIVAEGGGSHSKKHRRQRSRAAVQLQQVLTIEKLAANGLADEESVGEANDSIRLNYLNKEEKSSVDDSESLRTPVNSSSFANTVSTNDSPRKQLSSPSHVVVDLPSNEVNEEDESSSSLEESDSSSSESEESMKSSSTGDDAEK
ncbi:hypothetical protein WR25_03019 [Diploscapter pachys]|uniref:RING-type domain-containing protein n=1 Tax=Diploscapter pachys TaxID=2018661 RepID=A0A2A2LV33_9BILA|nr:hypothetical protein WR25_03019 [Diploscapter pachys]